MVRPEPVAEFLSVENLCAGYGKRSVVFDVSFRVAEGEIVTLLGHNGAGKTTTLRSVFGLQRPTAGIVRFRGEDVTRLQCAQKVAQGICFIPAERFVFPDLTVRDNLRLGWNARSSAGFDERLDYTYETFPMLRDRQAQVAGKMSGGQQRILSIGIALMAQPRLILLDEPSLGLAPAAVQNVTDTLRLLADRDAVSIVLLEQNVRQALRIADRAYVMRAGRIILEETSEQMRARGQWWDLF